MDITKCQSLTKVYSNGFKALNDISFGIRPKEIFGLLGPNGAGKSTTFNILTGLIKRTSGNVFMLDQDPAEDATLLTRVGVCPQFDALWDDLSPYEHLEIFGAIKGLSGQELQENI